jgi:7-keto-8-aminopelargonate synthetase-like enzyme
MGTLSKALGASGGYICGSRNLIEWLLNRARSFVYSTAPPPAVAAAALAAVNFLSSSEGEKRRLLLWEKIYLMRKFLLALSGKRSTLKSQLSTQTPAARFSHGSWETNKRRSISRLRCKAKDSSFQRFAIPPWPKAPRGCALP